ncbi:MULTISPECIES: ROK family protein [Microbacterium]|uniref:ROK family protein n=1 Tax=Microbacterium TaxID=33882 RepID=UPI0016573E1F|nr:MULTISPECIES: ROK family protein [Microbacterium]CAD5137725.1 ROK family protein [Microbacterium sp. Nx66]
MIVGVDIGGTKVAVAGFRQEPDGGRRRVTAVRTLSTPAREGGEAIVRAVVDAIDMVRGAERVAAVGVGTAGVVDQDGGITSATDAISGWAGFPLRAALIHALDVPVAVVNDVHAAAVAEAAAGAGRGACGLLMVAVGTGIGGAVVLPDGLRAGATGTAGSVGHTELALPLELAGRRCGCGGVGHVEAVASGPGLEQTYRERTGTALTLREVDAAARAGDAVAEEVIAEGARFLGRALAGAQALLDVEVIAVGGGVAAIGERYLAEVARAYRAAAMPGPTAARVRPAELGIDATVTGAAVLAPV